jgi:2-phosphoglycerate kinase
MSVALDQGILKCISTDTVRAVMRSFIPVSISPALHRSSYDGNDNDPVKSWRETCTVLDTSLEGLIDDAIHRNVGLVLEGVSLEPKSSLIDKWEKAGGVAIGCLLTVSDEKTHRKLLAGRGMLGTGQQEKDEKKLANFERIRMIQDEMIRLAQESKWQMIEQKIEPDPLEIIANKLIDTECRIDFHSEVSKEQLSDGDSSMVEEQFANENATNADHDAQLFE